MVVEGLMFGVRLCVCVFEGVCRVWVFFFENCFSRVSLVFGFI